MNKKIDPDRWYHLKEVADEALLEPVTGTTGYQSYWKVVMVADRDILKPKVYGRGRNKRIMIKGSNIIQFLAEHDTQTISQT